MGTERAGWQKERWAPTTDYLPQYDAETYAINSSSLPTSIGALSNPIGQYIATGNTVTVDARPEWSAHGGPVQSGYLSNVFGSTNYTKIRYVRNRPYLNGIPPKIINIEDQTDLSEASVSGSVTDSLGKILIATVPDAKKVFPDGRRYKVSGKEVNRYYHDDEVTPTGLSEEWHTDYNPWRL